MEERELKIEYVDIDSITPSGRNAKQHPAEQIEQIKKSITDYGMNDPIGVWRGEIVEGHGRVIACKELGIDKVPIIRLDDLTDEQRREYMLVHNKTTMNSDFDVDILNMELEDLPDFDAEFYDFELSLDDESLGEVAEDEVPEEVETRCKLGDVWQLGAHRLICGDSTDPAVIDRLMDGVKSDLVFTDPPYGMKKESEGVLNDNLNYDDLLDFNRQWIPLTFGALKDNGSWYCWGIDEPLMDIYSNILKPMQKENKITFRNLITWDKGNGQGQLSEDFRMYPIADEKCLFVMVGGDSVQGFSVNQEDYSESMDKVRLYLEGEIAKLGQSDKTIANALGYKDGRTVNHWRSKSQFALPTKENYEALREYGKSVLKDYDFLKKDYDELKKDFYEGRSYFDNTHDNMNNVWHFDRTSQEERKNTGGHVTPKPIALCSRAIKSSSREGEIVLDVFGGSGSTLIACEQLNRKCYMCELDEKYVSVIVNRWLNFTGRKDEIFCLRDGQKLTYDEVFGE